MSFAPAKRTKRKYSSDTIRLEWDLDPSVVEFRPLARGFSVWASDPANMHRLRKIECSGDSLTWRMAADNLNGSYGADGDLFPTIRVSGVPAWQADILKMCLAGDHFVGARQRDFLLTLPDQEIEKIWSEVQSLISERALELIDALADQFEMRGYDGMSIQGVERRIGLAGSSTISELVARLEGLNSIDEERRARVRETHAIQIEHLISNWEKMATPPTGLINMRVRDETLQALRKYVEDWIVIYGELPTGVHKIGLLTLNEINFDEFQKRG